MEPIKKPFAEPINYDNVPIDQLPPEYYATAKAKLRDMAEQDKKLNVGLAELSLNVDIDKFLMSEIHQTVSRYDDHVAASVFYTGLSTYLLPLNLALKAESGAGKSYVTTETVKFLPQENVLYIGSQSPKVISHENGVRKTKDGRNFEDILEPEKPLREDYSDNGDFKALMQRWKDQLTAYNKLKEESYFEVDLRQKVIVFLESVNPETFKMLKATMSRDHDFIDHKFVDEKGRVHVTRLIGAPVLIFNSLDSEYVEEFATRTLTVTPDTSREKIKDAMSIACKKANFPWLYSQDGFNKQLITEYVRRVRDLIVEGKIKAMVPFTELETACSNEATRDMRDFSKFLELMPSFALFRLFQRPIAVLNGQRYLLSTIRDVLEAKTLFDSVASTTKTGTEQRIINFYWEHVADKLNGSTIETLTDVYNKGRKKKLSSRTIRYWIERLEKLEWIDIRQGEQTRTDGKTDWKTLTIHPLKVSDNNAVWQNAESLRSELEKRFETWLNIVETNIGAAPEIILLHIDGTAHKLNVDELTKIVYGVEETFVSTIKDVELSPVSPDKPVDIAISETATSTAFPTIKYRLLSPSQSFQCDGETKGDPCPLLAEYEFQSEDNNVKPHYCKTHFDLSVKACVANGYRVQRDETAGYPEAKSVE